MNIHVPSNEIERDLIQRSTTSDTTRISTKILGRCKTGEALHLPVYRG
jgi:hypothetical protein